MPKSDCKYRKYENGYYICKICIDSIGGDGCCPYHRDEVYICDDYEEKE